MSATCALQAFGAGDTYAVLVWGWAAAIGLSVMCCFMAVAMWVADAVAIHLFRQAGSLLHVLVLLSCLCHPGSVEHRRACMAKGSSRTAMRELCWLWGAAAAAGVPHASGSQRAEYRKRTALVALSRRVVSL